MGGKVCPQTSEEDVVAQVRGELLQDGGPLGIGDAIEVGERGGGIDGAVAGDRMGRRCLIGDVTPVLAVNAEVDPRGIVGDLCAHPLGQVFGEGFVEPEVVPPPHRDQIAEPHVRHFVRDRPGPHATLGMRGR